MFDTPALGKFLFSVELMGVLLLTSSGGCLLPLIYAGVLAIRAAALGQTVLCFSFWSEYGVAFLVCLFTLRTCTSLPTPMPARVYKLGWHQIVDNEEGLEVYETNPGELWSGLGLLIQGPKSGQ